jgi:hypothetical protein
MESMRSVALLALVVALVVPVAARAQSPTPTPSATASASPTPTPTPTATPAPRTKAVQKVYDDYEADGVISACKHSEKTLKRTLKTITPQFDTDFPDFRAAVKAGVKRHQRGGCKAAAATPTATATPAPAATVTPVPTAVPTTAPSTGTAGGTGGASLPPVSGRLPGGFHAVGPPAKQPSRASPGRITPVPSATPSAVPTPTPTEFGPPRLVVQHQHVHRDLTVPGALLGAALLMAALLALSAAAAARSPRLAGVNHAWREAAYRTRGTWRDFSEWLRLGR